MPRKPGLNSEFVLFDVVYEDGTQQSIAGAARLGGLERVARAHAPTRTARSRKVRRAPRRSEPEALRRKPQKIGENTERRRPLAGVITTIHHCAARRLPDDTSRAIRRACTSTRLRSKNLARRPAHRRWRRGRHQDSPQRSTVETPKATYFGSRADKGRGLVAVAAFASMTARPTGLPTATLRAAPRPQRWRRMTSSSPRPMNTTGVPCESVVASR